MFAVFDSCPQSRKLRPCRLEDLTYGRYKCPTFFACAYNRSHRADPTSLHMQSHRCCICRFGRFLQLTVEAGHCLISHRTGSMVLATVGSIDFHGIVPRIGILVSTTPMNDTPEMRVWRRGETRMERARSCAVRELVMFLHACMQAAIVLQRTCSMHKDTPNPVGGVKSQQVSSAIKISIY